MGRHLPREADRWVKPAREALARHNLFRGFDGSWSRAEDGVDVLRVRNSSRIYLQPSPKLAGRWDLHVGWELRRQPTGDGLVVYMSSLGVNAEGSDFAPEGRICVVRYDVDHGRAYNAPGRPWLGRHLNVLQPAPLADHVHLPIPGDEAEWSTPDLIDLLLCKSFFDDIRQRTEQERRGPTRTAAP